MVEVGSLGKLAVGELGESREIGSTEFCFLVKLGTVKVGALLEFRVAEKRVMHEGCTTKSGDSSESGLTEEHVPHERCIEESCFTPKVRLAEVSIPGEFGVVEVNSPKEDSAAKVNILRKARTNKNTFRFEGINKKTHAGKNKARKIGCFLGRLEKNALKLLSEFNAVLLGISRVH
jgi:hypothetical protein